MIHIAICEDDEAYASQLLSFLSDYQKETGDSFKTDVFRDGQQLLFNYQTDYDILLLDIEMPKMSGMEAAKEIRKVDPSVTILFVTNMAQYALEGYTVQAKAYLLKPLNYYGFYLEMQSAIASLKSRNIDYLLVSTDDGTIKLPAGKVVYVETDGHDLLYRTASGETYRSRSSMKEADAKLTQFSFARSSVSYLVNLAYVTQVTGDTITANGTALPLSRNKRKDFMAVLTAYVGRR